MSEKLKWAKRAPITYYSVAGAKGKIVTRWIEPPEGYDEAGVITMYPGAIVKGYYQENREERRVLKGEVSLNYQGTKKHSPESELIIERATIPTYYNNSKEVVEIYFQIRKK